MTQAPAAPKPKLNGVQPDDPKRPFPALTPAQRYHFDVFGYVIIPNLLTPDEVGSMKDALYRLRHDLRAAKSASSDVAKHRVREARFLVDQPHHVYMGSIEQVEPALTHYATHPYVVGACEEIMGGRGHIVETNAHINSKAPTWPTAADGGPAYSFHRGLSGAEGFHFKNGLYHANFVKLLTNLTDLGPDDGGTTVIAGSHKVDAGDEAIIKSAYDDRRLIHKVVAPAGSGLLFTEALMHATGQITSDKERMIIIAGYTTSYFPFMMNEWYDNTQGWAPGFLENLPPEHRSLFVSNGYIQRKAYYRQLSDPAETRE